LHEKTELIPSSIAVVSMQLGCSRQRRMTDFFPATAGLLALILVVSVCLCSWTVRSQRGANCARTL